MSEVSVTLRKLPGSSPMMASTNALKVLWALEDAGHTLELKSGVLMVSPKDGVPFTKEQSSMLTEYRPQIRALVRYVERLR